MKLIYKLIVIVIYNLIVKNNNAELQAHLQFEDAQAA